LFYAAAANSIERKSERRQTAAAADHAGPRPIPNLISVSPSKLFREPDLVAEMILRFLRAAHAPFGKLQILDQDAALKDTLLDY
jgi:hypothetical protein